MQKRANRILFIHQMFWIHGHYASPICRHSLLLYQYFYFVLHNTSAHQLPDFFMYVCMYIIMSFHQLVCHHRNCEQIIVLASSLWHGSFSQQRPTRFGKRGNILIDVEIHAEGHHFHAENCRGCGQTLWSYCEQKKSQNLFLACLLAIRENLCSRKFPTVWY